MDFKDGIALIKKAAEGDVEDKLWERWLVDYSKMDQNSYKSFENYKTEALGLNVDTRTQQEIIEDILKEKR